MTPAGRPKSLNPKIYRFSIRLDKNTENRLDSYCLEHGITKGEAIRRAIDLLINRDSEA